MPQFKVPVATLLNWTVNLAGTLEEIYKILGGSLSLQDLGKILEGYLKTFARSVKIFEGSWQKQQGSLRIFGKTFEEP